MTVERAGNNIWLLKQDDRLILRVEAEEVSLTDYLRYVKMEPAVDLRSLPRTFWREAKAAFLREALFPMYALCEGDVPARFLRFFDFHETLPYAGRRMFWRP